MVVRRSTAQLTHSARTTAEMKASIKSTGVEWRWRIDENDAMLPSCRIPKYFRFYYVTLSSDEPSTRDDGGDD